ncbi:MAG TPA: NAD-dependent epimerase/dehydratase family protein [Myxococcales bacterium]|jgi:putative NADH-flavin reductase
MAQGKSLVIVGATGMVGGYALRLSLEHPDVRAVTVVGRRPTGVTHAKLREVLHADFADCGPLAEALAGHDAALYCIGAYTGTVPDAEFRKVTVDYTVAFA